MYNDAQRILVILRMINLFLRTRLSCEIVIICLVYFVFFANCASANKPPTDSFTPSGVCQAGDCKYGQGTLLIKDRYVYDGIFKDEKPNGSGVLRQGEQNIFTGNWLNGLPEPEKDRSIVRSLLEQEDESDGLEGFDKTGSVSVHKSSLLCSILGTILFSRPRICIRP